MSRLKDLFHNKKSGILSIYFTAGYPKLHDTKEVITTLEESGVDLIEVGIPFSDPVADGETIQKSSEVALKNGMNLKLLLQELKIIRQECKIPMILMGYLNPILQYGIEKFCAECKELEIDGTIIPDLPMDLYLRDYEKLFNDSNLINIFLVTPQTDEERIKLIDQKSDGFIYAVSSAAVTGGSIDFSERRKYLEKLKSLNLRNPILVGFGVSKKTDLDEIGHYANGAIIGSAFIRTLNGSMNISQAIKDFVNSLKSENNS